jgi:hypothetical protein
MGLDEIPGIVLKKCAKELCNPLARFYQKSFDEGIVPMQWKCAKVSPVHKKNSRTSPANYRPIALLPLVSKVMERYIAFHLVRFLETNQKLTKCQFGFRKGHSTVHPLLVLHQLAADMLDQSKEARILAFDIAGAFDTVWHSKLITKAKTLGIDGNLLAWLTDYLKGRNQRVCVDGKLSRSAELKAGVPQGSILGPVLFILFINDLPEAINNMPLLFADDLSVIGTIASSNHREALWKSLQEDIDSLLEWADENQMQFAPHKTQALLISRKKDRWQNPTLSMISSDIEETSHLNLLGVSFAHNGSVTDHLLRKAATASKLVAMLRRKRQYLSERARRHLYVALIRPLLEYGSPIFGNAANYALDAVDSVNKRAHKLFPSLPLDSLCLRRHESALCLMYRIVHGTAPDLLTERLKPRIYVQSRATRSYERTNNFQMEVPRSRTKHHQLSFLPMYIRLWNGLSDECVFSKDLQTFKSAVNRELRHRRVNSDLLQ